METQQPTATMPLPAAVPRRTQLIGPAGTPGTPGTPAGSAGTPAGSAGTPGTPAGPAGTITVLQEIVYKTRYARWIEEKRRREEWPETVERYLHFMADHLRTGNSERAPYEVPAPLLGEVRAAEGFQVIATQNPVEYIATGHLSEALRDRFEHVEGLISIEW